MADTKTLDNEAPTAELGENTVQVTFLPEGKTLSSSTANCPTRITARKNRSSTSPSIGITLDHACGGNCACTTCHVWIKEGAENLSPMDDDEADRLDMAADLQLNSRLGCQVKSRSQVKS